MFQLASEETFQEGQIIFKEGSSGDWVYVILSGSVEIFKTVDEKKIVIEVLKEGEVFGELGFLGGVKRTASARALEETLLGVIDRAFLDQEFNKISGDFRAILKAVVQRFKKMVDRASDFSSRQVSRAPKSLSIQFKTPQSFKNAYTGNISPQGLFIRTNNPLGKGEQFSLKMHLPDVADPLKVTCEVVWSKRESSGGENGPAGMGVKFCDLGKKDQETLDAFLDQVLEDNAP